MNRRSELKRTSGLSRSSGTKRKQPRRDWSDARAKISEERVCRAHRLGGCQGVVEAAHVLGRRYDRAPGHYFNVYRPGFDLWVHPDAIWPLCQAHHREYDAGRLDALPYLSLDEQVRAVEDAGGIALALRRISGRNYDREAA